MTTQTERPPTDEQPLGERLSKLEGQVTGLEKQVEANTRELSEMRADQRAFRAEVNARFDAIQKAMAETNRNLIIGLSSLVIALVGGIITVVLTGM